MALYCSVSTFLSYFQVPYTSWRTHRMASTCCCTLVSILHTSHGHMSVHVTSHVLMFTLNWAASLLMKLESSLEGLLIQNSVCRELKWFLWNKQVIFHKSKLHKICANSRLNYTKSCIFLANCEDAFLTTTVAPPTTTLATNCRMDAIQNTENLHIDQVGSLYHLQKQVKNK